MRELLQALTIDQGFKSFNFCMEMQGRNIWLGTGGGLDGILEWVGTQEDFCCNKFSAKNHGKPWKTLENLGKPWEQTIPAVPSWTGSRQKLDQLLKESQKIVASLLIGKEKRRYLDVCRWIYISEYTSIADKSLVC